MKEAKRMWGIASRSGRVVALFSGRGSHSLALWLVRDWDGEHVQQFVVKIEPMPKRKGAK